MDTGVLPGGKSGQSVKLITHLHLEPRLKPSGAIPLLPPSVLMPQTRKALFTLYYFLLLCSDIYCSTSNTASLHPSLNVTCQMPHLLQVNQQDISRFSIYQSLFIWIRNAKTEDSGTNSSKNSLSSTFS